MLLNVLYTKKRPGALQNLDWPYFQSCSSEEKITSIQDLKNKNGVTPDAPVTKCLLERGGGGRNRQQ